MREGVQLVWLVWVADQSEAGFAEAQLATYGIRPFGDTGSCENITSTLSHSAASGKGWEGTGSVCVSACECVSVGGGWAWLGGGWSALCGVKCVYVRRVCALDCADMAPQRASVCFCGQRVLFTGRASVL